MKVVFRCDASIEIGTGHVMRCLTLADELMSEGAKCYFICREHEGNLNSFIAKRGHNVYRLDQNRLDISSSITKYESTLFHSDWLGTSQTEDAEQTINIIKEIQPKWMIIDHYGLNICWETTVRPYCGKLFVIDDLADRTHDCDVLLDQTFGRSEEDYKDLVLGPCKILCGTEYALLRPEFARWRQYSLERRRNTTLGHILINLGGVDKDNITSDILDSLKNTSLPDSCKITVVMGSTSPWIEKVTHKANHLPWKAEVKIGVSNMAELMANSDLAIGAAGSTSWERCCLGLPTFMLVLADNQKFIANNLQRINTVRIIQKDNLNNDIKISLEDILHYPAKLIFMAEASANLLEGKGASIVAEYIKNPIYE